ncbi:hypothetical protein [Cypionkella sp.]|uniref:hypothetical protein n=1 Tax=Cypionkella sp. TaxID=2811411 RepID=UPI0026073EF7|nr:hypothetical protein [Cypionkella sp.]
MRRLLHAAMQHDLSLVNYDFIYGRLAQAEIGSLGLKKWRKEKAPARDLGLGW